MVEDRLGLGQERCVRMPAGRASLGGNAVLPRRPRGWQPRYAQISRFCVACGPDVCCVSNQEARSPLYLGNVGSMRGRRILAETEPKLCDLQTVDALEAQEGVMGRGILLWLIGVPIPIIIILALIWH
jgi:hypothetical protein